MVGDLRGADIALGGEGAPIVPFTHWFFTPRARKPMLVVNFGGVPFNSSTTRTLTLRNTGGSTSSAISLALSGTNANRFEILAAGDSCTGQTMAGGATCAFTVRFTPVNLGAKTAFVTASLLNCRAAPVENGKIVRKLQRGASVQLLSADPGWASVAHRDRQCWVAARFLSTAEPL